MFNGLFKKSAKKRKHFELWFENHDECSNTIILYYEGAGTIKHIELVAKYENAAAVYKTIDVLESCMALKVELKAINSGLTKTTGLLREVIIFYEDVNYRFIKSGKYFILKK